MAKPNIGFSGLSLMGAAMVGRMQSLGYSLAMCPGPVSMQR